MAVFLAETGWTAAVEGLIWEAAAVLARASPVRLGSLKLSVGAAGSIRSLTSAVRLRRGAGREERAIPAAGMPTSSTSGIWMRQRHGRPSPQPTAGKTSEAGALLLGNVSADTALACLELLTVQCRASDKRLTAESVESGIGTTILAGLAAKSAEAGANKTDPASAEALAKGGAAARASGRDVGGSRLGAQGKAAEAAALGEDRPNKRSMEHEEKIRAAHVLLQLYVQKKDDLGGRSVLKLISAMLMLRVFALEVLTELAETIRRRLVRVLPPDGLVAIVGAYCFFFTTPQRCAKAASASNCVRRLDHLPAPVQHLLVDALAEIWVRAGLQRYDGGARDARDAVTSHFEVNSARPINKRSEELPNACVLQPNAADEGRAVSAGDKHIKQLAVGQPVVNRVESFPVKARKLHFAAAHEGNSLSRAGAVSCAWALTRLAFSRKSILLENLKEYLKRELFVVPKTCPNGTQSSLVHDIAWKEEVIRLQEWGATAAAFVHLPGDQSPCVAVTVRKEMVKAMINLRVALLQKRKMPVSNPHQIAPAAASLLHKHMQPFSSQARALITEGLYLDAVLCERLQQAARSDSSRCLTRTEQSDCLGTAGHRKENLMIRDEDAATICGAATWMLRLSAITQQDNAPILEALQMLHGEDPFMFSLPKSDLCYFLAAAHEGAVADSHMVSEQTLVASPERRMTLEFRRGYPPHSNPETKGNNKLPAFLHWTLLLLPRVTTVAEGLFQMMSPRVLALLLTMLSLLPDSLATCEGKIKNRECSRIGELHALDHNTERFFPCRQHRSEHEITTRSGEQQHTSCDVGEHFEAHAFVNFEDKLRKFSSDLCRTVVERSLDFGQRDLMRAISAVKRLDSDAYSVIEDILCAWHARRQQRLGNVDESSDADNKQGDRSIATEPKGVISVDNVVQGRGDSSDAIRRRGQRHNIHKYSSNFSAAQDESPSSEALPTGMQSDPPVTASHSIERGRGCGPENSHVCLSPYYAADAEEDTSMLQLVSHVLRPCFSEQNVNKTDLRFPLGSTGERSFLLEKNEERSMSKPHSNRTFSEWNS